ncbi:hypothetical protein ACP70R_037800 [Stipagrostis hirtigluma subsp. patula]
MLRLDTATMEFSVTPLPPCLKLNAWLSGSFAVGETKDSTPCIARDTGFGSVDVFMRRVYDNGTEDWVKNGCVSCTEEGALRETMDVLAIKDGFVYLASSEMVLSLCLETMELEKLFPRAFGGHFYPYFMPWPPSGGFRNSRQDDDPTNA